MNQPLTPATRLLLLCESLITHLLLISCYSYVNHSLLIRCGLHAKAGFANDIGLDLNDLTNNSTFLAEASGTSTTVYGVFAVLTT